MLAIAMLVTLLLGATTQYSFQRGFIGYINEQATLRMEASLPRLQEAYAEHQDWEFVRHKPPVWFGLVRAEKHKGQMWDVDDATQGLIASDLLGAGLRMSLLDSQRQHVIGFPHILANSVQREITVQGQTVGWLVMAPVQSVTDAASLRFLDDQLKASLATGGLAVLLAATLAWWTARRLMAPVRAVAKATHSLAAGAYTTRVHTDRQDEIGQLARDFNQLALTLERNEQLRRNYIADISHELRTPLAVLQGELEAMEDGIHPATPQAFAMLQQEVHSLSKLVNDLHELSMADLGALQYKKEPLDLAALVEREAQGFVARCKDLGLELVLPPPAPSPLMVQADPGRLRQLIHNLLSNAARYTQAPGRLQITLQREGDNAVLDIQDSAPGVDAALLPKLFERFFRVESSRSRSSGGSGLGLSICESIVLAHAGSIRAMPSPLGGLWIQVQLPLAPTQPTLS